MVALGAKADSEGPRRFYGEIKCSVSFVVVVLIIFTEMFIIFRRILLLKNYFTFIFDE